MKSVTGNFFEDFKLRQRFVHAPPRTLTEIRRVGYVVSRPLKESELSSPKLVKTIVSLAQDAEPLLRYGWKIAG